MVIQSASSQVKGMQSNTPLLRVAVDDNGKNNQTTPKTKVNQQILTCVFLEKLQNSQTKNMTFLQQE